MFNETELNILYRYCVALTGDRDNAYDLLHESLEKFLGRPQVEMEKPLAYLRRVIKNLFVDHTRKNRDLIQVSLDEDNVVFLEDHDPETLFLNREQVAQILRDLSSEERELLYFWAVEGLTAQEIAERYDRPRGTILARLHRLKARIRGQVSKREVI